MTDTNHSTLEEQMKQRRRFLRLFGTAAAILPVTAIIGCSDDPAPAPSQARPSEPASEPSSPEPETMAQSQPDPQPEPEPAETEPMQTASEPAGETPQVSLDDPTAKALGYQHDASNVDAAKYPQRTPNQVCGNCTLFQGAGGDQWGPCQLFPGKVVNANGWCSGYTPKPS